MPQPRVSPVTAPFVFAQSLPPHIQPARPPCCHTHRVQVYVPAQAQQPRIPTYHLRFEPPLHQMSANPMPQIIINCISGQHAAHERTQISRRRLHNHVPVVRHPAVQIYPHSKVFRALRRPPAHPLPVSVIHKDNLTRVPAKRHVVNPPGILHP